MEKEKKGLAEGISSEKQKKQWEKAGEKVLAYAQRVSRQKRKKSPFPKIGLKWVDLLVFFAGAAMGAGVALLL